MINLFKRWLTVGKTAEPNLVRFIDAQGKNCGLIQQQDIIIPANHKLIQVAPSVFKLLPNLPTSEPSSPNPPSLEPKLKHNITKTVQMRPAIGVTDFDRTIAKIRQWLDPNDHPRVTAVSVQVRRENGAKAKARGFTADTLLDKVCQEMEKLNGIKPDSIIKDGMNLTCTFLKAVKKDK